MSAVEADVACPVCGSTELIELHDGDRQSIYVCAECGGDEP